MTILTRILREADDRPVPPVAPLKAYAKPTRSPLDDIAAMIRALTYEEHIALAARIWNAGGDGGITSESFAAILHRAMRSS